MDTSETYIKMCEKAEEIQALRNKVSNSWDDDNNWEEGDFYYKLGFRCGFHSGCESSEYGPLDYSTRIWLPRQDQLQEMVLESNHPDELLKIIGHFHDFACGVTPQFDSMEQLWLAFVMKELYSKIWSKEKEKWICE